MEICTPTLCSRLPHLSMAMWHSRPMVQNIHELARAAVKSNADQKLVARLMRALTIYGIFIETEEEVYEHNALSLRLSTPPLKGHAMPMAARTLPGIAKLPEYLAKTSYRNPGDDPSALSLFQFTNNTELEFFQWMQMQPKALESFNKQMAETVKTERATAKGSLADIYPFEGLQEGEAFPDEVVIVDVGGGYGHVLEDIRTQCPELKGKMVLQDLPKTLENHLPLENVEIVPYDFLKEPQPVKGARAYLLRHVLHDWSDDMCRQILRDTISALVEGKSRILSVETVLPSMNPPVFGTMMDINMMKYGGCARKESQWRKLFESVGLELVKVWPAAKNDSVMEVVPKSWLEKS